MRRFAIRILDHARRASQHAWALKHLADRFTATTIDASSVETQELWQTVVREHARGYRQETALLRTALEPVVQTFGVQDSEGVASVVTGHADASDLWSRIAHLLDLQKSQDGAVQAAFAMRSDSISVSLVQTGAFWRLLDDSDRLAAEIAGTLTSERD